MLGKKLPGLNGLRAIAALFVMFRHVFGIAEYSGDTTIVELNIFINHIGKEMVNLFFVISGFIITYILVNEAERSKTISIRNFYLKRFLRIWPLYFFLLIIVLVVLKVSDVYIDFQPLTTSGIVLLIFFLSNLQPFFPEAAFSVLPHYWSLAVEEQFYLIWPVVFKRNLKKANFLFPLSIVVSILIVRNFAALMSGVSGGLFWFKLNEFLSLTKFGSIAIGILGFFIIKESGYWKELIFKKGVQWAAIIISGITLAFPLYIPYVHFEVTAIAYMVIVANVSMNSNTVMRLENRLLNWLGSISYGIYMYHWVVIPVLIYLVKYAGLWDFFIASWQIPLLLLSMFVVIAVSHYSYFFFEWKVMKLGKRFLVQKPGM